MARTFEASTLFLKKITPIYITEWAINFIFSTPPLTLSLCCTRRAVSDSAESSVNGELCHQRGFVHAGPEERRKGGHRRMIESESHDQAFQRARAATCEACGGGLGRFGKFSLEEEE